MREGFAVIREDIVTMSKEQLGTFLGVDENQPHFELVPIANDTGTVTVREEHARPMFGSSYTT
jgi:hypothetical protein